MYYFKIAMMVFKSTGDQINQNVFKSHKTVAVHNMTVHERTVVWPLLS
jgi:hypothetical protein